MKRRSFFQAVVAAAIGVVTNQSQSAKQRWTHDWAEQNLPGARVFERATGREIHDDVLCLNTETGEYEFLLTKPNLAGELRSYVDPKTREVATAFRYAKGGIDIR